MDHCSRCAKHCTAYVYAFATGEEKYCLNCFSDISTLKKALIETLPDVSAAEPPLGWQWVGQSWFTNTLLARRKAEQLFRHPEVYT